MLADKTGKRKPAGAQRERIGGSSGGSGSGTSAQSGGQKQ
jgi:hypothetical protein